jgi:hypothetical protein
LGVPAAVGSPGLTAWLHSDTRQEDPCQKKGHQKQLDLLTVGAQAAAVAASGYKTVHWTCVEYGSCARRDAELDMHAQSHDMCNDTCNDSCTHEIASTVLVQCIPASIMWSQCRSCGCKAGKVQSPMPNRTPTLIEMRSISFTIWPSQSIITVLHALSISAHFEVLAVATY